MRSLVLATLALGGIAAVAQALHHQAGARVLVAAHRGGALLWPENSLLAFRQAIALGVEYLELDVHLSKDGEVVVIHDPTLDRTTTGAGPVRDLTLSELRALRVKSRDGTATAETIPTLDEVAELATRAGVRLLVEIKVGPGRQRYGGIEGEVLAILDRHRIAGAAVVMAFEPETWRRVRELRPDVMTGALISARRLELAGSSLTAALEMAARAGVGFVGLEQTLVTPAAVAQARQGGLVVGAWTVNDADGMRRVIDQGVDVLISDRPDVVKGLVAR